MDAFGRADLGQGQSSRGGLLDLLSGPRSPSEKGWALIWWWYAPYDEHLEHLDLTWRVTLRPMSDPLRLTLMSTKPTLMSFAQYGTSPQRAKFRVRSPAFASKRTIGSWSVGAAFQLGAKFGVGRCGGMEKTRLISLTSEERRTRPHMERA
jgi:hypothetical protein